MDFSIVYRTLLRAIREELQEMEIASECPPETTGVILEVKDGDTPPPNILPDHNRDDDDNDIQVHDDPNDKHDHNVIDNFVDSINGQRQPSAEPHLKRRCVSFETNVEIIYLHLSEHLRYNYYYQPSARNQTPHEHNTDRCQQIIQYLQTKRWCNIHYDIGNISLTAAVNFMLRYSAFLLGARIGSNENSCGGEVLDEPELHGVHVKSQVAREDDQQRAEHERVHWFLNDFVQDRRQQIILYLQAKHYDIGNISLTTAVDFILVYSFFLLGTKIGTNEETNDLRHHNLRHTDDESVCQDCYDFHDYSIDDGSMEVMLKTLSGKTIPVAVDSLDSVRDVRHRVAALEDLPPPAVRLCYGRRELCDECRLVEYNITDEACLFVVLRLQGGAGNQGAEDDDDRLSQRSANSVGSSQYSMGPPRSEWRCLQPYGDTGIEPKSESTLRSAALDWIYSTLQLNGVENVTMVDHGRRSEGGYKPCHAMYFDGRCRLQCGRDDCTLRVKGTIYLPGHTQKQPGYGQIFCVGSHPIEAKEGAKTARRQRCAAKTTRPKATLSAAEFMPVPRTDVSPANSQQDSQQRGDEERASALRPLRCGDRVIVCDPDLVAFQLLGTLQRWNPLTDEWEVQLDDTCKSVIGSQYLNVKQVTLAQHFDEPCLPPSEIDFNRGVSESSTRHSDEPRAAPKEASSDARHLEPHPVQEQLLADIIPETQPFVQIPNVSPQSQLGAPLRNTHEAAWQDMLREGVPFKMPLSVGADTLVRAQNDVRSHCRGWDDDAIAAGARCLMMFLQGDYMWLRAALIPDDHWRGESQTLWTACCLCRTKLEALTAQQTQQAAALRSVVLTWVWPTLHKVLHGSSGVQQFPAFYRGLTFARHQQRRAYLETAADRVGKFPESCSRSLNIAIKFGVTGVTVHSSTLSMHLEQRGFGSMIARRCGLLVVFIDAPAIPLDDWNSAISEEAEIWPLPNDYASPLICSNEKELRQTVETLRVEAIVPVSTLVAYVTEFETGTSLVAFMHRRLEAPTAGPSSREAKGRRLRLRSKTPCSQSCADSEDEALTGASQVEPGWRRCRSSGLIRRLAHRHDSEIKNDAIQEVYRIIQQDLGRTDLRVKQSTPSAVMTRALYFYGKCSTTCGTAGCSLRLKACVTLEHHKKELPGSVFVDFRGTHPSGDGNLTVNLVNSNDHVAVDHFSRQSRMGLRNTTAKACHFHSAVQMLLTHEPLVVELRQCIAYCDNKECLSCLLGRTDCITRSASVLGEEVSEYTCVPDWHCFLAGAGVDPYNDGDAAESLNLILDRAASVEVSEACYARNMRILSHVSFAISESLSQVSPCKCHPQATAGEPVFLRQSETSPAGCLELTLALDAEERSSAEPATSVSDLLDEYQAPVEQRRGELIEMIRCETCGTTPLWVNKTKRLALHPEATTICIGIQRTRWDPIRKESRQGNSWQRGGTLEPAPIKPSNWSA